MRAPSRVPPTVKPPSLWSKVVGKKPATSGLGKAGQKLMGKVIAPLTIAKEAFSAGEQILSPEARAEAVREYSEDLGTAGNLGRALHGGFFDTARAGSAFLQGVAQAPRAIAKHFSPTQYAGKEQRREDAQELAEYKKSARIKDAEVLKSLGDTPREFGPQTLDRADAEYFFGRPDAVGEADRLKVMAYERKVAELQGREPRSWEALNESGALVDKYDREANLYWTDEDRAAYAEMAKNEPDKLRSLFDVRGGLEDAAHFVSEEEPWTKDRYAVEPDGTLDEGERKSIFDPKSGFKAWRQQDAVETAAAAVALQKAERAAASEVSEAMGGIGAITRNLGRATEGIVGQAEKAKKGLDDAAAAEAEAAATRKQERIAFAKGLESDLAHSYTPNSAFQNPETRQRLMEEAYGRAEELGVNKAQLRGFLRNKGLLDKGFSESYADFYERNTNSGGGGGGLRTGSVGGRRTVGRAPKGGGIKTDQTIKNEQAQLEYEAWLFNERAKAGVSPTRYTPIPRQFGVEQ